MSSARGLNLLLNNWSKKYLLSESEMRPEKSLELFQTWILILDQWWKLSAEQ